MNPADIGLPPQFTAFRPGQEEAAIAIACGATRFDLVSMPTGSGKSIIYMAVANLVDGRALVVTGTKGLQAQLLADYGEIGLTDIRGQNNYRCVAVDVGGALAEYGTPGTPCSEGPCHAGVYCSMKPRRDGESTHDAGCEYYDAVAAARDARLVVTNYSYLMTSNRYAEPDPLGKFDLLILDEAHTAPDVLAAFCAIELDRAEVKSLLGVGLPPIEEDTDNWVAWANEALTICRDRFAAAKGELGSITTASTDRRKSSKLVQRLTELGRKLRDLASAHTWKRAEPSDPAVIVAGAGTDWVAEPTHDGKGCVFAPVWAHAYAEMCLFARTPKVVLVSALLRPAIARYLGISPTDMTYREFPSTFDPARRPFIHVPTTRVDRHMSEGQIRQWVNRIDQIIGGRLDRKGIVHTRSYDRARAIIERSKYSSIMLTHTTRTTREQIERFKLAKAPCVLVSPSVEEGVDFMYDLCRYQILAKVPFIDGRSRLIRARVQSDKTYSYYLTVLAITQQVGRGMRAQDDLCESFIVDDNIAWFWKAAKSMFPFWFKQAWRVEQQVPVAPSLAARQPIVMRGVIR